MQLLFWLFKMNFRLHWPQVEAFSLRTKLSSSKMYHLQFFQVYFKSVINVCCKKCWCHLDHLELQFKQLHDSVPCPGAAPPSQTQLAMPTSEAQALLQNQVWLRKHCTASVKIFHDLMTHDVSLFYLPSMSCWCSDNWISDYHQPGRESTDPDPTLSGCSNSSLSPTVAVAP